MKIFPLQIPSFTERQLDLPLPPGWIAANASVARFRGQLFAAVNVINMHVDQFGDFHLNDPSRDWPRWCLNEVWLAAINPDLSVGAYTPLFMPEIVTVPWSFRGFECPRLFTWKDSMWIAACSHGAGDLQGAKFFIARIDRDCLVDIRELVPDQPAQFEKNWMPEVLGDGSLRFHHKPGVLISPEGVRTPTGGRKDFGHLHGGTQIVHLDYSSLGIVHGYLPSTLPPGKQSMQHFLRFTPDGSPVAISEAFQFATHSRTEVALGMAVADDKLVVSYGRDNVQPFPYQERAHIASFDIADLEKVPYDNRTLA